MSDTEQLFAVLAGFTLLFGAVWVRPGGVLFLSQLGGRPRPRWLAGRAVFQNDRGGFLLGNLVPLGHSFVTAPWPLSVSPAGVVAHSATAPTPDGKPSESDESVPFADIKTATADGRTLHVNGRPFAAFHSKTAATRWAGWLTELTALPEAGRDGWVKKALAASCDPVAAAKAFDTCRRETRLLRVASTVLFAYCYLALGLAAFAGVIPSLLPVVQGYAVLILVTFVLFKRAEVRVAATGGGHGWMILVSPVDAFRAADHLFRPALEPFHPLAVAKAVARPAAIAELARRVGRDVRHPLPLPPSFADGPAGDAARWFAERMREALGPLLTDVTLDPPPPTPDDPTVVAYCPRCDGQFVRDVGTCSTCGIALRPLPPPTT